MHEFATIFCLLSIALFDEKGKKILLQTVILIQTKFIGGIIVSNIVCCLKVRLALVMFLAHE